MTTANQIESYQGDSALAGGLGKQGTQQVISGVWQMVNAIESSMEGLRARNFQRQTMEYQQRIQDRNKMADMIASNELKTNQMDDESRLKFDSEINDLQSQFIDAAKTNKLSDSGVYVDLNKKYSELVNRISIAKTNHIARTAEIKANSELYDPNSSVKTTTKQYIGDDGKSNITEQRTGKDQNPRRLSYNMDAFKKHDEEQRKLMAADPYHMYEPFVPLSPYDQSKVFFGPQITSTESLLGAHQKQTTSTPSFERTVAKTMDAWTTDKQDMELFVKDLLGQSQANQDGLIGTTVVMSTNKILEEYNKDKADDKKVPLIGNSDSIPSLVAKLNFARNGEILKPAKSKTEFIDKTHEDLYLTEEKANITLAKEKDITKFRTNEEIRQYNETTAKAPKVVAKDSNLGPMHELYKTQYNERVKKIAEAPGTDESKKDQFKNLDIEFREKLFAGSEAVGQTPNNQPHNGDSTALGTFGILKNSGHAKEAFLRDNEFADERKEFGNYEKYYEYLKNDETAYRTVFTPKYLNFLEKRVGKDVNKQLVYNYGGKRALYEMMKGNLDHKPEGNKATIREHLARAYDAMNTFYDNVNENKTKANISKWDKYIIK